jgi:NADH dehydrogenase
MQVVILRPSYFSEVWLSPALGFDARKGRARVYGDGEAKVSYISGYNVADFAVATTMTNESGNVVLELGGPEALSQLDVVRIFEQKLQKRFELEFVPIEALEQQHRSPDPLTQTFAALMLGYAKGDVIADAKWNATKYSVYLHSVADFASLAADAARTAGAR